ncbi:MAG: hypothetical protein PVH85_28140 [Desulfobacterales bacterium]
MSDETYFLIIILFGVLFILGCLYRLLSNRYRSHAEKQKEKIDHLAAPQMEKKDEYDLINNPAFSDLEINVFHENHSDDKD